MKIDEKGGALSVVLIALMIAIILGTAILQASSSNYAFGITDHKQQSSYYIAEAGARFAVSEILKEANANSSLGTAAMFFNAFENSSIYKAPFAVNHFTTQFGENPNATVTISGRYDGILKFAIYKVTSVGKVGSSKKTVSGDVKLTWGDRTTVNNFLGKTFIAASGISMAGDKLNAPGGIIRIKGDVNLGDFNGGSVSSIEELWVSGNLTMGAGVGLGTSGQKSMAVVQGNITLSGGTKFYSSLYTKGDLKIGSSPTFYEPVYVAGNVHGSGNFAFSANGKVFAKGVKQWYDNKMVPVDMTKAYVPPEFLNDVKDRQLTGVVIPEPPTYEFTLRPNQFFTDKSYHPTAYYPFIASNMKLFVPSGDYQGSTPGASSSPITNAIIVVKNGNITLKMGNDNLNAALIALNGNITIENTAEFKGIAIAKGKVTFPGGATVNMSSIYDFFTVKDPVTNLSIIQYDEVPVVVTDGGTEVKSDPTIEVVDTFK